MPIVASSTSPMDVVHRPGRDYEFRTRTMYMPGSSNRDDVSTTPEPQGFLIEIGAPGGSIPPHFHETKQFQVFTDGRGSLGRHEELEPVVVHYTDAYTTYGPILIAKEGMAYFTLRHARDPGAQYMPESRDREQGIPGKPGRSMSLRVPTELLADGLADEPAVVSAHLLQPHDDGLYVWATRAGPGSRWTGPDPASGDGAYWLVLKGSLIQEGRVLPEKSLIYVHRKDTAFLAQAGHDGAVVLGMQFGTSDKAPSRR